MSRRDSTWPYSTSDSDSDSVESIDGLNQNPRNPYLGLSLPGELYFGGVCRHVGRSAGRSAGRPAGRPGGARVVSGAEKKII